MSQLLPLIDAIPPIIGPRGLPGRHRWVVERSFAWLLGCCRLGVRYVRRADLLQGFLRLACALICLAFLDPVS